MVNAKASPTSMSVSMKVTANRTKTFENVTMYRSIVGALQYLTIRQPDIAFSVNKACQFKQTPMEDHYKLVKRILCYVAGTL